MTDHLLTTRQVARLLDVSTQRVNQLASRRGLGTFINPKVRVFTAAEVELLKVPGKPGRPRKSGT